MHPPLSISMSYGKGACDHFRFSDKIQTKTAEERDPGLTSEVSKSLYNGQFSVTLYKDSNFFEKSDFLTPFINQSPYPDMFLLGLLLEPVPGLPVNGDDHLHPLVLRICRFPTTPRSCTSPCLVCHSYSFFHSLKFHFVSAEMQPNFNGNLNTLVLCSVPQVGHLTTIVLCLLIASACPLRYQRGFCSPQNGQGRRLSFVVS